MIKPFLFFGHRASINVKRAVPAVKPETALSAGAICGLNDFSVARKNTGMVMLLPALQQIMPVIQVLVARLLIVRNIGSPATLFHNPLSTKNGVLVMVVSVDAVLVLDQMSVFDIPLAVTITDSGNVPGGIADRTGFELTDFN